MEQVAFLEYYAFEILLTLDRKKLGEKYVRNFNKR